MVLISNSSVSILKGADDQDPTQFLVSGLDPSIVAGYTLQKKSLVQRLGAETVAAYEIINNNAGSLTVSVMHPFSRGTCSINSPDPFEPPIIDPRWLSNPVDRQVLLEALRFNRRILATPSMLELQAAQFVPPIEADEDALNRVINNGTGMGHAESQGCRCKHIPIGTGSTFASSSLWGCGKGECFVRFRDDH